VRARVKDTFADSSPPTGNIDIELHQGSGGAIASDLAVSLSTSMATKQLVLTTSEKNDLLTDTTDMRVRIVGRACVADGGDEADIEVTMIRLVVTAP